MADSATGMTKFLGKCRTIDRGVRGWAPPRRRCGRPVKIDDGGSPTGGTTKVVPRIPIKNDGSQRFANLGCGGEASGLSGSRRRCCARSWQTCSDGRCARRTIHSGMASCRRDTAWSSARYIALAPALCGRISRLSRFRLRRRRRCASKRYKEDRDELRHGPDSGPVR